MPTPRRWPKAPHSKVECRMRGAVIVIREDLATPAPNSCKKLDNHATLAPTKYMSPHFVHSSMPNAKSARSSYSTWRVRMCVSNCSRLTEYIIILISMRRARHRWVERLAWELFKLLGQTRSHASPRYVNLSPYNVRLQLGQTKCVQMHSIWTVNWCRNKGCSFNTPTKSLPLSMLRFCLLWTN